VVTDKPDAPAGVVSASALHQIIADKEARLAAEAAKRAKAAADEERQQREHFLNWKIRPEDVERLNGRIRRAAEQGQTELLVGRFPSAWCLDKGRAINSLDPDWPSSLTGIGAEFHGYFKREMEPKGFKLRMEIVSFPDGLLGDVGAYLSW
jgi:hypothetical protein